MLAEGHISGNVYRFSVVNQAGADLSLLPGTTITIVVRAPNNVANGTIIHFNGTGWERVPTDNGGLVDLYATNATELGDYAVLVTGAQTPEPSGQTPPSLSIGPMPSGTPEALRREVMDAGFDVEGLYGVEGPGWILPDFVDRWTDPARREILVQVARALEAEPTYPSRNPAHTPTGVHRRGRSTTISSDGWVASNRNEGWSKTLAAAPVSTSWSSNCPLPRMR